MANASGAAGKNLTVKRIEKILAAASDAGDEPNIYYLLEILWSLPNGGYNTYDRLQTFVAAQKLFAEFVGLNGFRKLALLDYDIEKEMRLMAMEIKQSACKRADNRDRDRDRGASRPDTLAGLFDTLKI